MTAFQFPRVRDIVEAPEGLTCDIRAGSGACGRPATTLCAASQTGTRPPITVATCDAHAPVDPDDYQNPGTGRWTLRSQTEIERTQQWYQLPTLERNCLVAIGLEESLTPVHEGEITRHLLRWYADDKPPSEEFSDALGSLGDAGLITETSHDGLTAYEVSERGRALLAVGATHLETAATRPTKPGHR